MKSEIQTAKARVPSLLGRPPKYLRFLDSPAHAVVNLFTHLQTSARQMSVAAVSLRPSSICLRCARRIARDPAFSKRVFSTSFQLKQFAAIRTHGLDRSYFWANGFGKSRTEAHTWQSEAKGVRLEKENDSNAISQPAAMVVEDALSNATQEPPHRRRKRLKAEAAAQNAEQDAPLPLDASATLSEQASAAPARSLRRMFATYLALAKPRLAFLIVLTTTASYSIYPVPALLSTSVTDAPSLSTLTLLFLTSGTFMTIASANTLNMLFEPSYDARMSRTRNRPIVRGLVSKRAAMLFAIATGVLGTGVLWYGVNPTTAILGAGNLALYAFAYTPLKRIHPVNTWVGAVVGAVPPLMGWCAAASQYSTSSPDGNTTIASIWNESRELLFTQDAAGGWLIAALLFAWQFPHFFALSHGIRHEYANAGYKMLTSTNYPMTCRVSLRYSLAMFPICFGLSYYNVTDKAFVATSSVINGWMLKAALRNARLVGEKGSARALFWASVWQLPIVLVLAMVHKKGLWQRIWRGITGEPELEALWEEEDDDM